jgi:hypothetical protein
MRVRGEWARAGLAAMSLTAPIYSDQFSAANVWELDVPMDAIDKAAALFAGTQDASWEWEHRGTGEAATESFHRQFSTEEGAFFELRRKGWNSDISWVSADDDSTHAQLREVFEAFNLKDTAVGELIPGSSLRMFAAFYVVRSKCKDHNWHCDFKPPTFPALMTLITPLADYPQTKSFNLEYMSHGPPAPSETSVEAAMRRKRAKRRYEYKKGKAIVFGAEFLHSTEPGATLGPEPHAYLSFTFGTDDEALWPLVASAVVDTDQSRVLACSNGTMVLSRLGREIAGLSDPIPDLAAPAPTSSAEQDANVLTNEEVERSAPSAPGPGEVSSFIRRRKPEWE